MSGWATGTKASGSTTNAPGCAKRSPRNGPIPGQPRTISAYHTTSQGSILFPQGGDAAVVRKFHQKALGIFKKRVNTYASDFDNKYILAETLYYEATCALYAGDQDGAAAGYRECLEICKELASEPKAKKPQTFLMLAVVRCGDHAGAAKIADSLVATPPKDEGLYVQAACGYALAARAARAAGSDAALVPSDIKKAIACLREAIKRGWADFKSRSIPIFSRSAIRRNSRRCSTNFGKRAKSDRDRTGVRPGDLARLVSSAAEDGVAEGTGAVGERFPWDAESVKDAEIEVRHPRLAVPPVSAVLEAQPGSAGDQRRQVARIVRGAGAAAEQHDRVVEHAAVAVPILGQPVEEVRELPAQEQVVLREFQLPVLVRRVRERVMGVGAGRA